MRSSLFYQDMKTVYTIHNLQYQGVFPIKAVQDTLGLGDSLFTSDKLECYGCANYMKAGLVYADELTTVSPSYADEIQTAFYGERLDGLLRARKDQLVGILNGIDVNDYDPSKDPQIYANYDPYHLGGKETCKAELQKELGLTVDPTVPLVGIISRLSNQKGFDLIECVIRELMATGIQLVVLGMGEAKYTNLFLLGGERVSGAAGGALCDEPPTGAPHLCGQRHVPSCPASSSRAAFPR